MTLRRQSPRSLYAIALCAAVAVAFTVQGWYIAPAGDDIVYADYGSYYGGSLLYYPRWILRHWLSSNGRMANYLTPLLLYFSPRWLLCLLNGVATGLYMWMVTLFVARRQPSAAVTAIALGLLIFAMPWWDSSTMFDVSFNYVWASLFGLAALYMLLYERISSRSAKIFAALFALIAGQMHEAMSVPLVVGLAAYWLPQRRWQRLERWQRVAACCFAAGAFLVLFSPGIWCRFGTSRTPDDTLPLLLLKSAPLWLLLVVAMIIKAIRHPRHLVQLAATPWIVMAVAATASACFCAVGGIVGRSGWFAQTFSIIALLWMMPQWKPSRRLNVAFSGAVAIAILLNLGAVTAVQIRLGREAWDAYRQFLESDDGTVYVDITRADEVPWWCLGRPRGAIDNCHTGSRRALAQIHGKEYVVLPTSLRDAPFESMPTRVTTDEYVLSRLPMGSFPPGATDNPYQAYWRDADGRRWCEVRFYRHGTPIFLSTPVVPLPGDRLP